MLKNERDRKKLANENLSNKAIDLAIKNKKEIKNHQTFDSGYFTGVSHFENNERQKKLVFQSAFKYLKTCSAQK